MGACTACRAAKVKCEQVFPCQRCIRLGKECIPHESKQGQHPARNKKRARQQEQEVEERCARSVAGTAAANSEDAKIACQLIENPKTNIKGHYGLLALIRHWIALAIKRRSFALWARAGSMAAHCGISMDDVLCDSDDGKRRGMDFMYRFMLTPGQEQEVVGKPLVATEIPFALWKSIGILQRENVESALENRWVFLRETYKGITRFYVSPGFEHHITSRELIEDTFRANQMEVTDLWIARTEDGDAKQDFVRGFAAQVNYHDKPNRTNIKPSKYSNVPILVKTNTTTINTIGNGLNDDNKNNNTKEILKVNQLLFTIIPELDRFISGTEYIPPQSYFQRHTSASEESNNSEMPSTMDSLDLDQLTVDVTSINCDDDDFKLIYDMLKKS